MALGPKSIFGELLERMDCIIGIWKGSDISKIGEDHSGGVLFKI